MRWIGRRILIPLGCTTGCGLIIGVFLGVLLLALLLIRLWWSWTIPDLLPSAVEQGLVAGSIFWYTSFKLSLALAVLSGLAASRRERE